MLRKLWLWLARYVGYKFHKKTRPVLRVRQPPLLTDEEYEWLLSRLLAGVNDGWSRKQVKHFLKSNNTTENDFVKWLRQFRVRLLACNKPDETLAKQMMKLLSCGDLGKLSYNIGIQLLRKAGKA